LLYNIALSDPKVKLLLVNFRVVVRLQVDQVVRYHCVERKAELHCVEVLIHVHEQLREVFYRLLMINYLKMFTYLGGSAEDFIVL
jgi:hypothetical protein